MMKNLLAFVILFVGLTLSLAQSFGYTIDCGNDQQNSPDCDPPDSAGINPIKPGRANLHRMVTDLATFGEAPIAFTRIYNSRTTSFNSPYFDLGEGQTWQHNWNYEMRQLTSKTFGFFDIKVRYPNGNEYNFKVTDSTGAQLAPAADGRDRLYRWSGSVVGYTMMRPDGEQWDFKRVNSPKFRLQQVRNGTGMFWDVGYDANGKINLIVNCFGRWLEIERDFFSGVECISKVSTSDGRQVNFEYSTWSPTSKQVLTKVTYPDLTEAIYTYVGAEGTGPDLGRPLLASADDPCYEGAGSKTRYAYNYDAIFDFGAGPYLVTGTMKEERNGMTDQLVVSFPLGSGTEPQVLDGSGNETGFLYDKGRLVKRTDEEGRIATYNYDQGGYGHMASKTEPNGGTTNYVRDYAGRITSMTDALGKTSTVTFNSYGFEISRADELNRIIETTRNSANQITRIDYPDGSYETYTRNTYGQALEHRLRNGATETRVYYAIGETGGLPGDLKTFTDGAGAVSIYTWTDSGLISTVENSRGFVTSYTYTWKGLVGQIAYPDSSTKNYEYDTYGNLIEETDELHHSTIYTYDEYNYLRTKTDALNRATSYEYGLTPGCASCTFNATLRKIAYPSGKVVEYSYDKTRKLKEIREAPGTADEAVTTMVYDSGGDLVAVTDPNGHDTTYSYDLLHRKTQEVNALSQSFLWSYDDAGNILTVIRPDAGLTTNTYDTLNRLLTTENPNGETTAYTYDEGGNVATLTDAKNQVYFFEYDGVDRKTKMTYPDASYEEWIFDDTASLVQPYLMQRFRNAETLFKIADSRNRDSSWVYSDATPDVTLTYDVAGRMTAASSSVSSHAYSYDDANQLLSESTALGSLPAFIVAYTYNADGQRATLTYPDSTVISFAYTDRRQTKEIKSGATILAAYSYQSAGNRGGKILANGVVSSYAYDNTNRLTQIKHQLGSIILGQFDYTLNSVGNRTQKAITGSIPNRTEDYDFDAIDQVIVADYGFKTTAFAYDAMGNREAVTDSALGNSAYTTNLINQYTVINSQPLSYDFNGNLTGLAGWTYSYDSQSRMIGATDGSASYSVAFDYRNRPVARTINGTLTYLVYDDWNLIAEYSSMGTLVQRYVHGTGIDEVVSKNDGISTVYYLQDGLGSTVALTDTLGALLESYHYDVFGKVEIHDSAGLPLSASVEDNRFLFTGREWIQAVGLYDYRNRMYSVELGRFLQTDPIRFNAGDVNLYRYVGNSALVYIDPNGESKCDSKDDIGNIEYISLALAYGLPGDNPDAKKIRDILKKAPGIVGKAAKATEAVGVGAYNLTGHPGQFGAIWMTEFKCCVLCPETGEAKWSDSALDWERVEMSGGFYTYDSKNRFNQNFGKDANDAKKRLMDRTSKKCKG